MGFRHNNLLHNNHFHKDWQRRVSVWFDQAGAKKRRRTSSGSIVAKKARNSGSSSGRTGRTWMARPFSEPQTWTLPSAIASPPASS